jgi:DNA-binding NarL/FixJ family response regulator
MRVLLRSLPVMLRDMVAQALASQPGVEVISEPPLPAPDPVTLQVPDVVIVGTDDPDVNGSSAVLHRWPHSRVLLISASGERGSLVELQPRRTSLGDMSMADLLGVVTRAAERHS